MLEKYNRKLTDQWSLDPKGSHTLQTNTVKGSEVKTKSKVLLPRAASTTCWFKARAFIHSRKHSCIRSQPARHVKFDRSILGKLKSPVRTSETLSHAS